MNVLKQLFRRDFLAFLRSYPSLFFDTMIFFITNALVFGYITPQEGTVANYGTFLVIGAIASFGLIEVTGKVSLFIADLEGDRTISHALILPTRSGTIFGYIGFFWGFTSAALTLFLFPLGKFLLYKQFSLENISILKLISMFITANLFYGFFSLWIASLVGKMTSINWLWARVIGPMWMFGAYFYSWEAIYKLSPILAYINLINPMVYVMEGMRGAILGPTGYLPFFYCLLALWTFILLATWHAISRLKRRLDCV